MCKIGLLLAINFDFETGNVLRAAVPKFNYRVSDVVAFTTSPAGLFINDANTSLLITLSNILKYIGKLWNSNQICMTVSS